MAWSLALPSHLVASCCPNCQGRSETSPCEPSNGRLTLHYDGWSAGLSIDCTRVDSEYCAWNPYPEGCGEDSVYCHEGNLFNCMNSSQRSTNLVVPGGSLAIFSPEAIRDEGWYSPHYLKRLSAHMLSIRWPGCQPCCLDEATGLWHGRPFNGVQQFGGDQGGGDDYGYRTYSEGKGIVFGQFATQSYSYSLGNSDSGCNCSGSESCWDANYSGDLLGMPGNTKHPSPYVFSAAYSNVTCIDLGEGKTAYSGNVSFVCFGIHNRLAGNSPEPFGCCDYNKCECSVNHGYPGCGREGLEYYCWNRDHAGGTNGVMEPCDPMVPWDEACKCFCAPYGPGGTSPCSEYNPQPCMEKWRCACASGAGGEYDGCAWGIGNGWDPGGAPHCGAWVDRFGMPYLNSHCPQDVPGDHFCYGGPYNDCVRGDAQIDSCHPDCTSDFRESGGAQWDLCQRPGVGLGQIVKTVGININPPGMDVSDIPWCYGCTAEEYFNTFTSGDYYAVGTGGKNVDIHIG